MCVLDKKSYLTEALQKCASSHTKGQTVESSVTTVVKTNAGPHRMGIKGTAGPPRALKAAM